MRYLRRRATIGIEEHYLHFSADARLFRIHRKIDITASTTSGTLTAFMQRKSIGHSRKNTGCIQRDAEE